MLFERKRLLVSLIVESADLVMVSPHILKIDIALKEPVKGKLVVYIYRQYGSSIQWTDEENSVLCSMYATADRADILKTLSTRSWLAIVMQAATLGLERHTYKNSAHIPKRLSYQDQAVLDDLLATHGTVPLKSGALWLITGTIWLAYKQAITKGKGFFYPLYTPDV